MANNEQVAKIGFTIGDFNGIGPEILLKSIHRLQDAEVEFIPIIYGSRKILNYYRKSANLDKVQFHEIDSPNQAQLGKFNVINISNDTPNIEMGQLSKEAGEFAFHSVDHCIKAAKAGEVEGVVTMPVNKGAVALYAPTFKGHTEMIANIMDESTTMVLVNEGLRVALCTNHIALKDLPQQINEDVVIKKAKAVVQSLKQDFFIHKPKLALLSVNPHSGDNGAIGNEELDWLNETVEKLKQQGVEVYGPYPADAYFGNKLYQKFDAVLAMYHDQGLAPFKALAFGNGVNVTIESSIVRTSPDHGTAFDIVGKNQADISSTVEAIYTNLHIIRNRAEFQELQQNKLVKQRPNSK